jgi:probable rRNA maturation factor
MSLHVDVSGNGLRIPLARTRIAAIAQGALEAERVRAALLSVTLLGTRQMAALNRRHLGHAGATDVISFGFRRHGKADPVIGDIYICPAVAGEHARARGVPVREELARLVVHGVLHVLGYDHPEGSEAARERSPMWRRQERVLQRVLTRFA